VLLAKTLSEMGQRVLLIDADLRKPQMHHRLGINNLSGLSNLLTDDGQHWRQVVQTVPGYDNWSVISAGRRPPDPTRLLSSQRMHQLVAELTSCGDYDLVLFDTPPVLGLADAALVAEHCDGLMLLVSLGRVDRGLPRESVNRIRSSGAPLLGIVTNAIKETNQGANAYGYGYGKYGYGYGYGGAYGYGGYGYAAYDTSATYAYYAEPEAGEESTGTAKATPNKPIALPSTRSTTTNSWQHWRNELQQKQRRFMRWLDS
jgi:capsular exopolysaccharide synthesis family protein